MKTQILLPEDTKVAADILKSGGLVAIPTETVYGLAANALDKKAVESIFKAKGRPCDNPLIVHISQIDEIYNIVKEFSPIAKKLAAAFWPGPLTMILKKSDIIPQEVSGGLDSVAVRLPQHPIARRIIKESGCPLAAPSANLSGSPSPTKVEHVISDLYGKIDAIVDAGTCGVGLESTVVSLCTDVPRLLRPGAVTPEQLREVLGKLDVDVSLVNPLKKNEKPLSPGMKYKHYAPKVRVVIIKGKKEQYINYINKIADKHVAALCYDEDIDYLHVPSVSYGKEDDLNLQAEMLFDSLRKVDKLKDIDVVYARCPRMDGIGLAVYNRLIRAAGFNVVEL